MDTQEHYCAYVMFLDNIPSKSRCQVFLTAQPQEEGWHLNPGELHSHPASKEEHYVTDHLGRSAMTVTY